MLKIARANGSFNGTHQGQLIKIDPELWPDHIRLGIIEIVPDEQLEELGLAND